MLYEVITMRKLPAGNVRKANTSEDRMRILSAFSNELCTLVAEVEPANREKELRKVTARFGDNIGLV